jgi:hypothetical protein
MSGEPRRRLAPRAGGSSTRRRGPPARVRHHVEREASRFILSCVQRRLTRSAGVSPVGAGARGPVAWMAGRRETDALKPIDIAISGMFSESPGRNGSERTGSLERSEAPEAEPVMVGRRQQGLSQAGWRGGSLRRGESDGTGTRTRRATGETLFVPPRNRRRMRRPITSAPGKWVAGERVAEGPAVATKRGNARRAKGPCCSATPPTTWKAGAS